MTETITQTKICTRCKNEKQLIEFSKNKKCKLGVVSECKKCESTRRKLYYKANAEHIKEVNKEYIGNNRDKISKAQKKHYTKNKAKLLAYSMVYRNMEVFKKQREKKKALVEARKQLNKELIFEKRKTYYRNNRNRLLLKNKLYREENLEKIKKYQKEYCKSPVGNAKIKNIRHKRRDGTKQGDATAIQMMELQQNAKVCYWCGISLKKVKIHIDHYFPLSKGGRHTLSNLVITCQKCNLSKHAKDPLVFANEIGKLF